MSQPWVYSSDSTIRSGQNENISTASLPATVWPKIDTQVDIPTSAATASVVSTSVEDDGGSPLGTGAQTLLLVGVDSNFDQIIEVVTLSGTTPVNTLQTFWFIDFATVLTAGSNNNNVGDLDVRINTSPVAITCFVEANSGQSSQALMVIPNPPEGTRSFINNIFFTVGKSGGSSGFVTISFNGQHLGENVRKTPFKVIVQEGGPINIDLKPPLPVETFPGALIRPGDVIWHDVISASGNGLAVSGYLSRINLPNHNEVNDGWVRWLNAH